MPIGRTEPMLRRLDASARTERGAASAAGSANAPASLPTPTADLGRLLEALGLHLFTYDPPLRQYLSWAEQGGVFDVLCARDSATAAEIASRTVLTENGAEALLGVLSALGLSVRSADGSYALADTAREYLVRSSPYYIGEELYAPCVMPIPARYSKAKTGLRRKLLIALKRRLPAARFGAMPRLRNQHARNLPACVVAVRTGEFAGVRRMMDVAGGSGAFAIPLALEYPEMKIVLTELPEATSNVRAFLAAHGLENRIEVRAMDAFATPWSVPRCDGIFVGNFLHGFGDDLCNRVLEQSFERLDAAGRIWLHERIWNDNKDGPLATALSHAIMRAGGEGKQRTASELSDMLRAAGFDRTRVTPTAGAYALVTAEKL